MPALLKKKKIGEHFLDRKLITIEQLQEALKRQPEIGKRFGEVCVELGYIDMGTLNKFLAELPERINPTSESVRLIIREFLKKKTFWNDEKCDEFEARSKEINKTIYDMICEIDHLASYAELAQVFAEATNVPYSDAITGDISEMSGDRIVQTTQDNGNAACYIWHPLLLRNVPPGVSVYIVPRDVFLKFTGGAAKVLADENIKDKLKGIFKEAVRCGATDIHVFPIIQKGIYKVEFRILGELHDIETLNFDTGRNLTTIVLNWAKQYTPSLRVDDVHRPQDAKITLEKADVGMDIDVRVSLIRKQNMTDADIVMRLLYKAEISENSLMSLGFSDNHLQILKTGISRNMGIILVVGATGSGKSRTVNTLLSMVPRSKNVLTIEDPIEYMLPNGRQFQTLEWEDLYEKKVVRASFSDFAKAFKRHDPDVIFLGELRDTETTDIAFHLAKTGHLVFATLHANRAVMIPEILVNDYGIHLDVVADNLLVGVQQILVKKLCSKCKAERTIDAMPEWTKYLRHANAESVERLSGKTLYEAYKDKNSSCPSCIITSRDGKVVSRGYDGRTLFAETYEFGPKFFEDKKISVVDMEMKLLPKFGNILTDAVDKTMRGITELDSLRSLL